MKRLFVYFLIFFLTLNLVFAQEGTPFTASIPYQGEYASGEYMVFKSSSNYGGPLTSLQKPLIFIEGFDANGAYGINPGGSDPNVADLYTKIQGYPTYMTYKIHNEGHDIVILNFQDGGDYIQKNAMLLVELINQINANKPNPDPLVVAGYSMGGVVARYALTYMEEHGMDHETRLFISMDSPQKGAHVPVGLQALTRAFENFSSLDPSYEGAVNELNSRAGNQMLKYTISSETIPHGEIPINPLHTAFYNELNSLNECNGFPTQCRNIAISMGSWNGIGQRSNVDWDGDGTNDLQHSGMPLGQINIPQNGGSGGTSVWELEPCELVAAFTIQTYFSSCYSENYPYFGQRATYMGMGNETMATYWYVNSMGFSPFPSGAFSRLWYYKDLEPLDFAPGGYMPLVSNVIDGIESMVDPNEDVKCHHAFSENTTFVSTNSAFAFDSDDLFYDISSDPDRLEKTPFDAIIGITGDNQHHKMFRGGYTAIQPVLTFLVDELKNDYGHTCAYGHRNLSGIVPTGTVVNESGFQTVAATNYSVEVDAEVLIESAESIELKPGFSSVQQSHLVARIQPCMSKACNWSPVGSEKKGVSIPEINVVDDLVNYPSVNRDLRIELFPNPSNGIVIAEFPFASGSFQIYDNMGTLLEQGAIRSNSQTLDLDLKSGVYTIRALNQNNTASERLVIE